MNKNTILTLIVGVAIGVATTLGVVVITSDNNTQTISTEHNTMSMTDMNKQLEGFSGDDFDKAFIEMMITHHEGAIDMAELIPGRAKHDEIKKLGEDIIEAQTKEIADMKRWQAEWGYSSDSMEMMHQGN